MTKSDTRILLFDIETSANLAYVWGKYQQDVIEYEQEKYILCYVAKWLGHKKTKSAALPDFDLFKKDKTNDKKVVESLWELLDEADIVIAHYGDGFDIKVTNARFLQHGIKPPSPYKTIDTAKVARKYFKFNSNKLNDLAQHLGLGEKVKTGGFELWKGCMDGDQSAFRKMLKYNKQDVHLLEKVYMKLRSWIDPHPNVNFVEDDDRKCPTCGSDNMHRRGFRYSNSNLTKYPRYNCQDCGAWSRGRGTRTLIEAR